ncbi:MAG: IS200/IS605 family transposase [Geminicoccaceae bacterium]
MVCNKGSHCACSNRYQVVWSTKYRYDVLHGKLRLRIREIIHQVCRKLDVEIIKGVLSTDHVHMFIAVPPKHAVSDVVQRMKGRSSCRVQQEFPAIRKRYWGRHFWAKGYFSATSSNITNDVILQYLDNHIAEPTEASR